jgi:hypothetical protein
LVSDSTPASIVMVSTKQKVNESEQCVLGTKEIANKATADIGGFYLEDVDLPNVDT